MEAEGKLKSKIVWLIPLMLGYTINSVYGKDDEYVRGKFFGLHVTPFLAIVFIIPKWFIKK